MGPETLLPSLIHVVPQRSGVRVPAAALVTTAGGQTAVVLDTGQIQPVEVLASASGMAIIDGIQPGQRVRAPGRMPPQRAT